jgi:hypothetical protein
MLLVPVPVRDGRDERQKKKLNLRKSHTSNTLKDYHHA